ncbi:sensor domain-containing diguanylate cyclase [Solidesulfovibrio alcoholivorans]|uniref:sensor domain-containing diguanylate cyclase n=1 Tax=Solidesulfovibrio alcoholivorans TaxID=81406 RepID=UPI0004962014|nr:diguanylate cyclase [Solidesulfovibrio alcoholivorans]
MNSIPFIHRIGTKIIGIFLLGMLPLVGVIAALNIFMRQNAVEHGRDRLFRILYEAAGAQESVAYDLMRELRNLVARPETQRLDAAALDGILGRLAEAHAAVSNAFVCDAKGVVIASAKKPFAGLNSAKRRYYQDAMRERGLVAGDFVIGRVTGNPVLHFALAIPGPGGGPRGVAVVSLNLRRLAATYRRLDLPEGIQAATLDAYGHVLAGYPDGKAFLRDKSLQEIAREALAQDSMTGSVVTRQGMLYVYKLLRQEGESAGPYGIVLVGTSAAAALAQARDLLFVSAGVSVGSLCLAVLLVVFLGRGRIGRRLEVLAGFAGSLSEDRVCRLPPRFGNDEIGLLGQRLADMSRTLHDKNEHLAAAMDSLARERDHLSTVVGELREAHDALERQASQDFLTGLGNRRRFNEKMLAELSRFDRYGTPLSLVLFDIDDFKKINDSCGHQVGDEVLRRLGGLTLAMVRSLDEAYRVGGEEFAVVLPHTDTEQAMALAERLREHVAALAVALPDGGEVRFTISLGVAQACPGAREIKDLYATADDALYAAKRGGKNRTACAVVHTS